MCMDEKRTCKGCKSKAWIVLNQVDSYVSSTYVPSVEYRISQGKNCPSKLTNVLLLKLFVLPTSTV